VCAARGVWLHVDGAYGLPAAATPSARHLFAGLERADSVSVDAHKWLYLPKACGVVLVRDESVLVQAFAHDESYMLHDENERHAVDTTLEYSRPFRALKLWLAFRTHGAEAFREAIEQNLAQARLLRTLIDQHDDLEIVGTPGLSIVPFRHLPADGRDLDAHTLELSRALQADGRVYVSPAVVDGNAVLRPCIVNFRTTDDDVRALVDVVRELGAGLVS
jgi:aromatic-L-amino-acid decarboxylase